MRLIKAVLEEFLTSSVQRNAREGVRAVLRGCKGKQMKNKILVELQSTGAILDAKAPADAMAFKEWLNYIRDGFATIEWEGVSGEDFEGIEGNVINTLLPREFWKALGGD